MAVSAHFREQLQAQETGEVLVALLTVTHADSPTPSRISSDPTTRLNDDPLSYGTVSRGHTYLFIPFTLTLPTAGGETTPAAQLTIDNVSRELTELIRSSTRPATILLEVVCASTPDTVERRFPNLKVTDVSYNADTMSFNLSYQPLVMEPYPAHSFSPGYFPGIFPS